jgi:molybdenum cofactor cytidylyltransferase
MGCLLKQGGGLYQRLRVGAVLLAAGEGSRLGGVAKPLLSLQGVPLINRHLVAMSGAGVDEVVVVTGYHYAQIEPAVETFPVTVVRNPHPEDGQQSSVRLGLEALGEKFDVVLVVLADQPLIGTADLTELISAFKKRPSGSIIVPVVNGQRGNPIVLSMEAATEILGSDKKLACRKFIENNPDKVYQYETANDRFTLDLDTQEDLQAFEKRTGWKLALPKPAHAKTDAA